MNTELDTARDGSDIVQTIQNEGDFKILPYTGSADFNDKSRFEKLSLTSAQKIQIGGLLSNMPAVVGEASMAGAYTVTFPKGLPHTLMKLEQGGYGTVLRENGKIVGTASLYSMTMQAAVLGVFTAMSIASGQYFLAQINGELKKINQKLDDIIKFLYGEKRAELLSEISFIKETLDNYSSIMKHEVHRLATVGSIQESKKIAIKDIEFYLSDLEEKIRRGKEKKGYHELSKLIDREIHDARENLDLSIELYLMSSIMEIYYAQNFEEDYVNNVEEGIKDYIKSINDKMLIAYGKLARDLDNVRPNRQSERALLERRTQIADCQRELDSRYRSVCERVSDVLQSATQTCEYYITQDGSVYCKRIERAS